MIFSNLKVLLAQRNISVSKVSADTNISRTTLTALCSNKSTGIQFDTLDILCSYLNVLPSDLVVYSQFRITFEWDISVFNNTIIASISDLINGRKMKINLLPEFEYGALMLNHYTDQDLLFERFVAIIKDLPPYYISHINEQIKQLLLNAHYDDNLVDAINSFNIASNLY